MEESEQTPLDRDVNKLLIASQPLSGGIDASTAPHRIPADMLQYGEENNIFEMMQSLLEQLLIYQPSEPIQFMISHLQLNNDSVPKIVILGPPASGKTTIAMWLCKHLSSSLVNRDILSLRFSSMSSDVYAEFQKTEYLTSPVLIHLLQSRLAEDDCVRKGWILDGIPETREQTLMLQTIGIVPRHVIVLSAPDTVLIERNLGKRVDPKTGEIYHTTFDWPSDVSIQNRLVEPQGISEPETVQKLLSYHRNIAEITPLYPRILKVISADQPCMDVFYQALTYVQSSHRSNAPFTPRVVLLGPMGSGKSLQAALLAQKYGLVNLCCGQLLKEVVATQDKIGMVVQSYFGKKAAGSKQELWAPLADQICGDTAVLAYICGCCLRLEISSVPDTLIMKVLVHRLIQPNSLTQGWVLHGFPRDPDQARLLDALGHKPNRVFFLNVPFDTILERLTLRRMDPVTGERYHLLYKPPPTMEIQERLLQNPKDSEERVKFKLDLYYRNLAELQEYYPHAISLNGDQDPYTVFEYIESGIIAPLPKKVH